MICLPGIGDPYNACAAADFECVPISIIIIGPGSVKRSLLEAISQCVRRK